MEISIGWGDDAHVAGDWLDDEGGYFVFEFFEDGFGSGEVVVLDQHGGGSDGGGDAGTAGCAEG